MRKVTTLLGIGCLALLFSCSSESDNDTGLPLLKRLEGDVMAKHSEYNFEYDGRKLKTITYEGGPAPDISATYRYYYTGDLITKMLTYDETNTNTLETVFTYDASQRLIKKVEANRVTGTAAKSLFTYTTTSTVEVRYYWGDLIIQENYSRMEVFYLQNGEVARNDFQGGSAPCHRTFEYDQCNNPMMNVLGFDKIQRFEYQSNGLYGAIRNMKKHTFYLDNVPTDVVSFDIFYDDNKYPLTSASTEDSPGPFRYRYEYY